jgi:hypothetical protein
MIRRPTVSSKSANKYRLDPNWRLGQTLCHPLRRDHNLQSTNSLVCCITMACRLQEAITPLTCCILIATTPPSCGKVGYALTTSWFQMCELKTCSEEWTKMIDARICYSTVEPVDPYPHGHNITHYFPYASHQEMSAQRQLWRIWAVHFIVVVTSIILTVTTSC